ncbi:MAG: DUF488 domain-containing protein [Nitrospinae bacterium]|nr:DUF488 domain-containing protein [Nitrospinota bacterium]
MDFQKLLFLAHQEAGFAYYDFVPYHYGCYSFQAASDLEVLKSIGWIETEDKNISLANGIPTDAGLRSHERNALSRFMAVYGRYRGRYLIHYVYRRYPYYAIHSKIAEDMGSPEIMEGVREERKKIRNEGTILFTLGYEGMNFEQYVNRLLKNGVRVLCDVRKNPISRKYGFSKGALSRLLPKLGVEYAHIPELGIVSEKRKDLKGPSDYARLFDEYRKTLPQKEFSLEKLRELLISADRIALTCFEKDPSFCHRRCVSDYMETHHDIKTVHL